MKFTVWLSSQVYKDYRETASTKVLYFTKNTGAKVLQIISSYNNFVLVALCIVSTDCGVKKILKFTTFVT